MAKARITDKGNVQVVMTQDQWQIVNEIFQHVRLGDRNLATTLFSNMVLDLSEFNSENDFETYDHSDFKVYVTRENKYGEVTRVEDFTIELDERDNDERDWD